MKKKAVDTTKIVDYVLDSLKKYKKTLTPEKLDDLSTHIGEILINAEEHSTTSHRFSVGYCQEFNQNGKHFGLFKLVILNFGQTIYEKFKDPNCPNRSSVEKMKELSKRFINKRLFLPSKFEEETLWTLYALQQGVTSIAPEKYTKRGNGSIQFIESFFNIKGEKSQDEISNFVLLSGKTKIVFDGKYNLHTHYVNNDRFKIMSFNKPPDITNAPDNKYVKTTENYFPGTLFSCTILFNEDDLENEIK